MIKAWSDAAWEDFGYWTKQDKKTLKRILQLLKDIDRNGYEGIGKPERLSGDLASYDFCYQYLSITGEYVLASSCLASSNIQSLPMPHPTTT